ncbi:MAG: hypothetical protein HKN27_03280 [Silicimonas sp.]|nr:hypothetical protein [Silicimonas sp.]
MKLKNSVALAATCLTLVSAPAQAGGMAEPLMEPEVIAEEAAAGSSGFVLPLILLVLIAVAIGSSGDSGATF